MKKLLITMLAAAALFSARAQVVYYRAYGYPYSYQPYPYYYAYPGYTYYGYPVYTYSRPNYAVSGTLLGALAGGLIGNSIHHQGWEGAGIGAAAGLLLGSLAEHSARVQERAYMVPAPVYAVPPAPTVNTAPTAPPAPAAESTPPAVPPSAMASANSLFGR